MSDSTAPQWHSPGRFEALGPAFFTYLQPTPVPAPHWVATSASTALWMNLNPAWLASDEALQVLSGNVVADGSKPLATVYSGHQFGHWAG